MKGSHQLTFHRLEEKANRRNSHHGGQDHPLQHGDRMWLRKRVLARNKIQDFWESIPYEVLATTEGNNMVHRERSLNGISLEKVVTRIDLLEGTDINEDDKSGKLDQESGVNHLLNKNGDLYKKYLTCQRIFQVLWLQQLIPPQQEVRNIPDTGNKSLRRSRRVSKGQHGNLHKLPMSTVSRSQQFELMDTAANYISQVIQDLLT